MTKKDFLNKIILELKDLPPNVVSDILFDYQDYFESKKEILSEEEAIFALGSIENLITHYKEEYSHLLKTKKLSFTQEIPTISESFININETPSKSEIETVSKEDIHDYFSVEDTTTIDFNMKNDSEDIETIKKISKKKQTKKDSLPKKKVNKKSFLGYLLSIPLLAITIPIGSCLGLSAGALYISSILIAFAIGIFIFGMSLIPFALSISGICILFVKSFSTIIFTSVPSFLTEFPSSIILLFSTSFLFLSLGLFFLGIAYVKSFKKTIFSITKSALNFIFKKRGGI
ncbi:MAG: hypothetical protein ACRDDY_17955 [Clostridium sp.]|uniref:hypothetical protein n=1 Tax=Clostridium sp. TaxID=1506 RepID=UPI003EE679AF